MLMTCFKYIYTQENKYHEIQSAKAIGNMIELHR